MTPAAERLAVLALTATCFAMSLNANVFAALNPYLAALEGYSVRELGVLVAASGLAGGVAALSLGPMVDRAERRRILVFGTAGFALASCGYLCTGGFYCLLVVRIATGFVAGLVLTGAATATADLVAYERRGRAMALVTAGILLAVPVGMPIAVALAEAGWWRGIFVLQIVFALLATAALWRAVPNRPKREQTPHAAIGQVLRAPMVLPALASVLLYTGAFFATMQFLGTWLDSDGILPRAEQAWLWIGLGLVSAIGGAGLGRFIDGFGKRRWVLATTLLVAIGLALMPQVSSVWTLCLIGVPIGIMSSSRSAALLALVSSLVPSGQRGTLMGLRSAAVNLGTGVFPAIAGWTIDVAGFETFFYVAAGSLGLSWLLVQCCLREGES